MINILFMPIMLFCCVFMSQAQTTISTAELNGTKWKLVSPKDDGCLKNISFTLRSKIDRIAFVHEGKTYKGAHIYLYI